MFRKSIVFALVLSSTIFIQTISFSAENPSVMLNGKMIDAEAKLIDGRIYLPVRAVGEAIGAEVSWNEGTNTAELNVTAQDELVPAIVKKVSPSVVGIIGNWKDSRDYVNDTKYVEQFVHGTGVIISQDGHILTNAHVVKEMGRIIVVLSDGQAFEAKLLCIDEESDLAQIKIEKNGLQSATFANEEDIVVGKTAISIGTPISFTLRNSASIGIVSGIDRSLDSAYRLIQTDAAINPGNSGGPLVNAKGMVIGINSSKFMGTGIEGLGFSIPVGTIKYVMRQFDLYGKVRRPSIGVDFEEDWTARYGLSADAGLKITQVKPDYDAAVQGVMVNDIMLSINDEKIHSITDLNETMKKYTPDDKVTIKLKREKVIHTVVITLGENKK